MNANRSNEKSQGWLHFLIFPFFNGHEVAIYMCVRVCVCVVFVCVFSPLDLLIESHVRGPS